MSLNNIISKNTLTSMYPSKLLLFGEYGILKGFEALAVPYNNFYGSLEFAADAQKKFPPEFIHYLKKISGNLEHGFQMGLFESDVKKGLVFNSNIPREYGLGSSGALIAAVFERYSDMDSRKPDMKKIVNDLAIMESFFHGKSSGIDPLVSLLNSPIHVRSDLSVTRCNIKQKQSGNLFFFLIDSRFRGKTGELVNAFLNRLEDKTFYGKFESAYSESDLAIASLLEGRIEEFFEHVRNISIFQMNEMSELIPDTILDIFKYGMKKEVFTLKILGSGKGGYYLGISEKLHFKRYFQEQGIPFLEINNIFE